MEAIDADTRSRRKPITYGKTSRLSLFSRSNPISATRLEGRRERGDSRVDLVRRIRDGESDLSVTYDYECDASSNKRLKASSLDMKLAPRVARPVSARQGLSDGVYDVPSSDEDYRIPETSTRAPQKRRRLQSHKDETARDSTTNLNEPSTASRRSRSTLDKATPSDKVPPDKEKLPYESYSSLNEKPVIRLKPCTRAKSIKKSKRAQSPVLAKDELRYPNNTPPNIVHHNHLTVLEKARLPGVKKEDDSEENSSSELATKQISELQHNSSSSTNSRRIRPASRTPPKSKSEWSKEVGGNVFLSPGGLDIPNLRISSTSTLAKSYPNNKRFDTAGARTKDHLGPERTRIVDKLTQSCVTEAHNELEEMAAETGGWIGIEPVSTETTKDPTNSNLQVFGNELNSETQRNSSQATSLLPTPGPRVTYAARNRTVLQGQDDDILLSLPLPDSSSLTKPSRRIVSVPYLPSEKDKHKNTEDLEDSESNQITSMRSVHELKEAGVNARLAQEMEGLLDDLEDCSSISQERSTLQELATKLSDTLFIRQFIDKGFVSRLSGRINSGSDSLVRALRVVALLRVVSSPGITNSLPHLASHVTVNSLCHMLEESQDVLALAGHRKSNVSKYSQMELQKLSDTLLNSPCLWRYGNPGHLSLRSTSLQCLEYIMRFSREAGIMHSLLSAHDVDKLVAVIVSSQRPSLSHLTAEIDLLLALSILESSTINYTVSKKSQGRLWTSKSVEQVTYFLPCIQDMQSENPGRIWTLALRLSLNLINSSPSLCDLFSNIKIIETILKIIQANFFALSTDVLGADHDFTLDNLVLSLGLLIKLAERNEDTRKLFLYSSGLSQSPLDILLQIFVSRLQNAFEASNCSLSSDFCADLNRLSRSKNLSPTYLLDISPSF